MKYFKYLKEINSEEQSKKGTKYSDSILINSEDQETKYLKVFKKIPLQLLDLFLVYFVTFSIFPAIEANIKSSDNLISDNYFEAVFCFLTFNVFSFIGNISAQLIEFPTTQMIIGFASLRLLFIPLYLFFNYRPKFKHRGLPVLIKNDWILLVLNMIIAYTSGHLSVLSLRYSVGNSTIKYKSSAGMLAAVTIVTGMGTGLAFSLIFPEIV